MARKAKFIPTGPSHLSRVIAQLQARPKLELPGLRYLKIAFAEKNNHFGSRHFVKDHLPRIRYANPDLQIVVERVPKTKDEHWRPEMELRFQNGQDQSIDLEGKWSTGILRQLMETAGGEPWQKWKVQAAREQIPIIPEEAEGVLEPESSRPAEDIPTLKQYRATLRAASASAESKEGGKGKNIDPSKMEQPSQNAATQPSA